MLTGLVLIDKPNQPLIMGIYTLLSANWVAQVHFFGCQPLNSRFDRRLEMINEVLVYTCCLFLLTLTPWNPEQESLFLYSWLLILLIQLLISLNLCIITCMLIKALRLIFSKCKGITYRKFGIKNSPPPEKV